MTVIIYTGCAKFLIDNKPHALYNISCRSASLKKGAVKIEYLIRKSKIFEEVTIFVG